MISIGVPNWVPVNKIYYKCKFLGCKENIKQEFERLYSGEVREVELPLSKSEKICLVPC